MKNLYYIIYRFISVFWYDKIVRNRINLSSKPGRLVLMLTDRYAGKKALLINENEEKTKVKKCLIGYDYIFPKGLVVRIQRYPRKFTKRMG